MKYQTAYLRVYVLALLGCLLISEAVHARGLWFIFCDKCTSIENNTRLVISDDQPVIYPTKEESDLLDVILHFEHGLNPDTPDKSKIIPEIIGHGSTSIGFRIPGFEDLLIRRLPGFSSYNNAKEHIFLINRYRTKLHQLSIQTTKSQLIALEDSHGYGVVYVVQPFLQGDRLAKNALKNHGDKFKKLLLARQAEISETVIRHNALHPASAVTVDIVNNNWEIYNLNPDTMKFDVRLNDIAQPLFKENYELTYDFSDQAFSIISPLNWLIVQSEMQKEFGELFEPRNLLMQALWGYDEVQPTSLWYNIYAWFTGAPEVRAYPHWAMETANNVLRTFHYASITSAEALAAHQQDKNALSCLDLYREGSHWFRKKFRLNSNVYMTADKNSKEMYVNNDHPPSYSACFMSALRDAISEFFYGSPQHGYFKRHQASPR